MTSEKQQDAESNLAIPALEHSPIKRCHVDMIPERGWRRILSGGDGTRVMSPFREKIK
jgi:hypothetical protein